MPPLDTGSVTHTLRLVDPLVDRSELTPADFPTVGQYLKAARERRGYSLVDVADTTRVRRAYLAAIEEGDHSALPSRPFAIGYVRAYAKALDLDAEAAAERYKIEAPDTSDALRAPIGVKHNKPERRPLYFGVAAVLVVAVIGWNVAQRVFTGSKPAPAAAPAAASPPVVEAPAPQGPISLGAPTPPPADQTTPVPYVTPGLHGEAPVTPAKPANMVVASTQSGLYSAPAVFEARGQIYGSPEKGPAVVLQARKAASLIVRGAGGEVYFARQLAEGEAYRAPVGEKLQAEVTDPSAFSIYVNGQLRGALAVEQTPLDKAAAQIAAATPVKKAPPAPKPATAATATATATAPATAAVAPAAGGAATAAKPSSAAPSTAIKPATTAAAPAAKPAAAVAPAPARAEPAPAREEAAVPPPQEQ